jgi:hypothetical protein
MGQSFTPELIRLLKVLAAYSSAMAKAITTSGARRKAA